jgi:hypothetical protein
VKRRGALHCAMQVCQGRVQGNCLLAWHMAVDAPCCVGMQADKTVWHTVLNKILRGPYQPFYAQPSAHALLHTLNSSVVTIACSSNRVLTPLTSAETI